MVRNDLLVAIPSFFKCPISLDVMKSPVSLCTGVTYDRSSIQTWLDNGNNTCPATMQVLDCTDFVPNLTLSRLIKVWSDTETLRSDSGVSRREIRVLVKNVEKNGGAHRLDSLVKIVAFAAESGDNRRVLASFDGFPAVIVGVLSNVGVNRVEIEVLEQIVKVLNLIISETGVKEQVSKLIMKNNQDCLNSIVPVLSNGSVDSKIESVKFLEAIAFDSESKRVFSEKQGLLSEIFNLLSSETNPKLIEACLSFLINISTTRPIRIELVRFKIVSILAKLLSKPGTGAPATEKALKLLETMISCAEGRTAVCEDAICIPAIIQRMIKVSDTATNHALVILWSICYMIRDRKAQDMVTKNNGVTMLLLLLQSNCSPAVRQMIADLIKIFRVNSKSCLASYETKTTHIMPY